VEGHQHYLAMTAPHCDPDRRADVAIANDNGLTALHFAGYNGHIEVVQELLRAGADSAHASEHLRGKRRLQGQERQVALTAA
jgi:ankyrin repeat protein